MGRAGRCLVVLRPPGASTTRAIGATYARRQNVGHLVPADRKSSRVEAGPLSAATARYLAQVFGGQDHLTSRARFVQERQKRRHREDSPYLGGPGEVGHQRIEDSIG